MEGIIREHQLHLSADIGLIHTRARRHVLHLGEEARLLEALLDEDDAVQATALTAVTAEAEVGVAADRLAEVVTVGGGNII